LEEDKDKFRKEKDDFCLELIKTGYSNPAQIDIAKTSNAILLSIINKTNQTTRELLRLATEDKNININFTFVGPDGKNWSSIHTLLFNIIDEIKNRKFKQEDADILREFIYYYLSKRKINDPKDINWLVSEDIGRNICRSKNFAKELMCFLLKDKRFEQFKDQLTNLCLPRVPTTVTTESVNELPTATCSTEDITNTDNQNVIAQELEQLPTAQTFPAPHVAYYELDDYGNIALDENGEPIPVYESDLVDPTIPGVHVPRPKDLHYAGPWDNEIRVRWRGGNPNKVRRRLTKKRGTYRKRCKKQGQQKRTIKRRKRKTIKRRKTNTRKIT
jgi:hypothetical protein